MPSATIKIFLVHGDPKRLRTAELSNWTGKAVAGPRSEFDDVVAREEALKPGVYLLTGFDPETGQAAVYVGEAEAIRERVKYHLDKDYWNHIAYFTSKDENLTKAHIKFLEGRLIDQAKQAGRATVINTHSSGARLPEADREDMEIFLEKIHQLLPALGVEAFIPAVLGPKSTEKDILACETKGIKARARRTPNGIVVLADSQAVLEERPSAHKHGQWIINQRQELRAKGDLAVAGDHLRFTRDVEFASPSAAAAVIHGGPANGLIAWRDASGKTLREIESVADRESGDGG